MTSLKLPDDDEREDLWDIIDGIKHCVSARLEKGLLAPPAIVPTDHLARLIPPDLEFVLQRLRGCTLQGIALKWVPEQWCFDLVSAA